MVNGATEESVLRLIPLLPLAAAAYHGVMLGLVRRPTPRTVTIAISCGAVLASFVASCVAFWSLIQHPNGSHLLVDNVFSWIGSGVGVHAFSADVAFLLDPLSSVMTLVITGVGSLIHIYSVAYMDDDQRDDKGFQRFFCYLNLFTFSMLILVLADNLVLMFLGWEGVGLCSFLLIGFWYSDEWNAYCGSKAFIVNRIGDFGFLLGLFLLFSSLVDVGKPAVEFQDIERNLALITEATLAVPEWLGGGEWLLVNVIALCFFVGAVGKSAQLPLYVWLPDAMAGPTPVSALIHAATMVTAGVYLVCRMGFLFAVAPFASMVVAWTGALTAVFAAVIAIGQTDIKKVLAYSTVSQLGYMFLAAGCGGYTAAVFHVASHAFFKALLFLGAGSVILALHHEQNLENMGGLWRRTPRTHVVFLIGVLTIAGFPGLSGFFSKDEILVAAFASEIPGHTWLYGIGLATSGLTAFYMFRLHFLTFYGESRASADIREHIEEPGKLIIYPLYVLAFFAIFFGYAGLPQVWGDLVFGVDNSNSLANFLMPTLAVVPHHQLDQTTEVWLAAAAITAGVVGFGFAWFFYMMRPQLPERIAAALRIPHQLLVRKFYVDEAYDLLFVRPLVAISDRVLFRVIDVAVIDGLAVGGIARLVRATGTNLLRHAQSGFAQTYIFFMIAGAVAIVWILLR